MSRISLRIAFLASSPSLVARCGPGVSHDRLRVSGNVRGAALCRGGMSFKPMGSKLLSMMSSFDESVAPHKIGVDQVLLHRVQGVLSKVEFHDTFFLAPAVFDNGG